MPSGDGVEEGEGVKAVAPWRDGTELLKEVERAKEFWTRAPVRYKTPQYGSRMELEVLVERYPDHNRFVHAMDTLCKKAFGTVMQYLKATPLIRCEGGVQFVPGDDEFALSDLSSSGSMREWGYPRDRQALEDDCQIRMNLQEYRCDEGKVYRAKRTKLGIFLVFQAYELCPRFAMLEIYRWFDSKGVADKLLGVGESRMIRKDGFPDDGDLCWTVYSGLWNAVWMPEEPDTIPYVAST